MLLLIIVLIFVIICIPITISLCLVKTEVLSIFVENQHARETVPFINYLLSTEFLLSTYISQLLP